MTKRSPVFRNSDERLRKLEREVETSGAPDAAERLLIERARVGEITPDDLSRASDSDLRLLSRLGLFGHAFGRDAVEREIGRRQPPLPTIIRAWDLEQNRRRRPGEGERFWVRPWTSSRGLDLDATEAALRAAGARIAARSYEDAWPNQPEIVVFSGLEPRVAVRALRDAGIDVAGAGPKTWGGDALPERRVSPNLLLLFPTEFCAPPDDCDSATWERGSRGNWTLGDYGCANYRSVLEGTRTATPEEYAPAVAAYEAENGRRLRVYTRSRYEFDRQRRERRRRNAGDDYLQRADRAYDRRVALEAHQMRMGDALRFKGIELWEPAETREPTGPSQHRYEASGLVPDPERTFGRSVDLRRVSVVVEFSDAGRPRTWVEAQSGLLDSDEIMDLKALGRDRASAERRDYAYGRRPQGRGRWPGLELDEPRRLADAETGGAERFRGLEFKDPGEPLPEADAGGAERFRGLEMNPRGVQYCPKCGAPDAYLSPFSGRWDCRKCAFSGMLARDPRYDLQ